MRVLLVAPLHGESKTSLDENKSNIGQPYYESRNSFQKGILDGESIWEYKRNDDNLLPVSVYELKEDSTQSLVGKLVFDVLYAELNLSASRYVVNMLVELADSEMHAYQIPQLERAFTSAVQNFLVENKRQISTKLKTTEWETTPLWVNRTLLLEGDQTALTDWIMPGNDPNIITLPQNATTNASNQSEESDQQLEGRISSRELRYDSILRSDCRASIVLGWGNNVVYRYEKLTEGEGGEWSEFVKGLIDAQVIWCLVDALERNSKEQLLQYVGHSSHGQPSSKSAYLKLARDAYIALANLRVHYSELNIALQGLRKDVAINTLEVWGFENQLAILQDRISDIETVAELNTQLKSRRFQKSTAIATGILSGLVILQTGLDLVAVAFSGGEPTLGREIYFLSILSLVRWAGADGAIAIALILTMMTVMLMARNSDR